MMKYELSGMRPLGAKRRRDAGFAILWMCLLIVLGASGSASAAEAPDVSLASDGDAKLPIRLVDPDGEFAQAFLIEPSLNDLQATLNQITGATFERNSIEAVAADASPAIYVGVAKDLEALGVPQDLELHECYIATTANGSLILSGDEARGVSHAIYRLLFHLGCRWYYPGEAWAVIPTQRDLSVRFDTREQPDFPIQRRIWVGHGLHGEPRPAFDDWQRRNFVAQPFDVQTNHTWLGINPKTDFETHPEWFAEVDGERQASKPAYANPEVIQQGIDHALSYFDANPHKQMVTLSPPDGLGFDTSERAIKQAKVVETFKAHHTTYGRQKDGTLVSVASENVFHFVNEVARAVQREHPGKMVGILAYSAYAHPPTFELEPNVYVELTSGYRRTPLSQIEQIMAFSEKAKHLGIYEYYDVEQWSWERPGLARAADIDYLQGSLKFYYRHNIRALTGEMSSNFGPYGVGYYVITRLLWDTTQDARAIEREFYEHAFGPAAEPMQRVYRRWESKRGRQQVDLAATYRDLAEATRLTEDQPAYRKRVNRIKMYAHFLKIYLLPKEGISTFKIDFGEEEARRRVDALADWVARITPVHIVHGQAFNDYFRGKAEAMLGLDISKWGEDGVPTEQEIESIFKRDLEELADVPPRTIPLKDYSQRLRLVTTGDKVRTPNHGAGSMGELKKATVIVKLDAGETATLNITGEEATYAAHYLSTDDFETGMPEKFATPIASGKLDAETLEVPAREAGYYIVHLKGGSVQSISHPHLVPQDRLEFTDGRLYFFVPRGTQQFTLEVHARGAPTIKLLDPEGNTVVQQDGYAVTENLVAAVELPREWTIDVPEGADNAVWCLEGPRDVYNNSSPTLRGVPPYYALTPGQLLMPAETLPPQ